VPAAKPTGASVRAYDVGFGDCFLLTFNYASGDRHILIDFGSTRLPSGKSGKGPYMERIARQIAADCGNKLTAVVATHRHKDHISGFAKDGAKGSGAIIAGLQPEIVLQPWTEDPKAAPNDREAPKALRGARLQARLHLQSLRNMNLYAESVREFAKTLGGKHLKGVRDQLEFLGDDNGLANRSAVVNLMTMGKRKPKYLSAHAPSGLESLLPGVKVHVLGPPTLVQDARISTQTAENQNEFWHARARFWARQARATAAEAKPLFPRHVVKNHSWDARWFIYYARQEHAGSMLSIVRCLDDAMNNTSLILLFEFGGKCLLFPGDAQWENWRYALSQKKVVDLLKRVTLYKVGHHGSLNATPKSLWKEFDHKGGANKAGRLLSVLSTKEKVHGSEAAHTEVPRRDLVDELKAKSTLSDTRSTGTQAVSLIVKA